tara:strand:+ start:122 stop:331 length:210 start_codon:yes stop_codon:yes gene_type:complete
MERTALVLFCPKCNGDLVTGEGLLKKIMYVCHECGFTQESEYTQKVGPFGLPYFWLSGHDLFLPYIGKN